MPSAPSGGATWYAYEGPVEVVRMTAAQKWARLGMALATVLLFGCTVSAAASGVSSSEVAPSEKTPTDPSPPPQSTPETAVQPNPGMPTCPPDTAAYDEESHEAPPVDAPVADCFVPEISGQQGPPKQAVPLPSEAQ